MNTHAEYRRHSYQPTEQPDSAPAEETPGALAHHRDPSLAANPPRTPGSKRLAWVRPTELASYAAPMVGRGIDLHAELTRRARRTPVTAARSLHRAMTPAARPTADREGLGL